MPGLLDEYMTMLSPTDEEKRQARANALVMAGLGMIGARKNMLAQDLSRAAVGGVMDYNQQLRDAGDDRLKRLALMQHLQQMQTQQQTLADQAQMREAYKGMPSGQSASLPSLSPTPANAAALTQAQSQAADPYAQYMARAEYLDAYAAKTGNPLAKAEADKYREHALKFRDENQGFETVGGPNNTQMLVQRRKYGLPQELPYAPKPQNAHFLNIGGKTVAVDPVTGNVVPGGAIWENTNSPDALLSSQTARRGQDLTDARARELNDTNRSTGQLVETANGYVRVGKDNSVTPVMAGGEQLQPKPTGAVTQQIASNAVTLNKIDRAIAMTQSNPNAFGARNYLGDTVTQRIDPGGVTARAMIADIAGQKIHDRSGAAVTVGEAERLKPYVPNTTDTPATIAKKLTLFKQEYMQMQKELQGGKTLAEVGAAPVRGSAGGVIDFSQLPK